MKRNCKKVIINLDEIAFNHFKRTPTFKNSWPNGQDIKIGENELNLNHVNFSHLKRVCEILPNNIKFNEVKS